MICVRYFGILKLCIGLSFGVEEMDEQLPNFISSAAEMYTIQLLEQMCQIADHRAAVDFDTFKSFTPTNPPTSDWVLEVEEKDNPRFENLPNFF